MPEAVSRSCPSTSSRALTAWAFSVSLSGVPASDEMADSSVTRLLASELPPSELPVVDP